MGAMVSQNHQPHDCLLNRLFRRRSKKTSKLRVTGFCVGNSPGTGDLPTQMTSNAEKVSISWRHHDGVEFKATSEYQQAIWPFNWQGLTLIPAWIINNIHYKVRDEITCPFPNFNGGIVEILFIHPGSKIHPY